MKKTGVFLKVIQRVFFMLCIGLLKPAAAVDVAAQQAFFRDATGQLSIQQVETQHFTPYTGVLSHGYDSKAALWIRLTIPASEPASEDWVIRLKPAWHDTIRLFDSLDGFSSSRTSGDLSPWIKSSFHSYTSAFRIPSAPTERAVYLSLESVHSLQVHVELLPLLYAERKERQELIAISIYIGLMLVVFLWIIGGYFFQNDSINLVFSSTQLIAVFYSLAVLGILRLLADHVIPNVWLHWLHIVTIILYPASAIYFYIKIFEQFGFQPLAAKLLHFFLLTPAICLIMLAAGLVSQALALNALGIALFSLSIFLASLLRQKNTTGEDLLIARGFLRAFFAVIFFIGLWGALPLLGVVSASQFSMWLFLLHGPVLTSGMGSLLLLRRQDLVRQQSRALEIAHRVAESERKARTEQSQLLAMMNHEIKTPMTVLNLLISGSPVQEKAQAQINTVSSVLERCMWLDHLQSSSAVEQKQYVSLGDVAMDAIQQTQMSKRFDLEVLPHQTLFVDAFLIAVVVSNLIDNALKYSSPESIISVSVFQIAKTDASSVCLEVINTAGRAGLPDPDRMFEKFYRSESTKNIPGTGIGLHLVKKISTDLGGSIRYDHVGDLIRFRFFLPC